MWTRASLTNCKVLMRISRYALLTNKNFCSYSFKKSWPLQSSKLGIWRSQIRSSTIPVLSVVSIWTNLWQGSTKNCNYPSFSWSASPSRRWRFRKTKQNCVSNCLQTRNLRFQTKTTCLSAWVWCKPPKLNWTVFLTPKLSSTSNAAPWFNHCP